MAERKGGKWIEEGTREAVYVRDGYRCAYCDRAVTAGLHASIPHSAGLDHILPHSHGGHNRPSNLVTVCGACNSARGAMTVEAFAAKMATPARPAAAIVAHVGRQAGLDLTPFRPLGKAMYAARKAAKMGGVA